MDCAKQVVWPLTACDVTTTNEKSSILYILLW